MHFLFDCCWHFESSHLTMILHKFTVAAVYGNSHPEYAKYLVRFFLLTFTLIARDRIIETEIIYVTVRDGPDIAGATQSNRLSMPGDR